MPDQTQVYRPRPQDIEILPPHKGSGGRTDSAQNSRRFPWLKKILLPALLMLLYTASPLDLIPDFIPVLGQMDDLIVNGGLLAAILRGVYTHYRGSQPRAGRKPLLRSLFTRWILRRVFR